MTSAVLSCTLAVALFAVAAKPVAAEPADEVQALVERAAEYIGEHGQKQAFADFSRPDGGFVVGGLYIFCFDDAGIELAHGGNPKLIGKSFWATRDPEGKLTTVDMYRIAQTKGRGWYEYLWPNQATGRVAHKVAYVIRIDDKTVCASGYYKPDQP